MDKKVYFYGLDAFRAIAAILVIFGHVELIKKVQNKPNTYDNLPFYMAQGDLAVTFFFVLSGFLITYLLLLEKDKNGTVSLKKFYMRRIFRIWPLYFLLTFIGFYYLYFTEGITKNYLSSFYYYLAVLPNLAPHSNPLAFQSWSIGVEEQFYILWPLLFCLPSRKIIYPILMIIFILYLARAFPVLLIKSNIGNNLLWLKTYFDMARFDNMAIGGGIAYLMHHDRISFSANYNYICYFLTIIMLMFEITFPFGLHHIVYSIIFGININFIVNTIKEKSWLETGFIKYLGKISYGIYMWHVIAIKIVIYYSQGYLKYNNSIDNIILHIASIAVTIIISSLSYELYENTFLNLKYKYANVKL